MTREREYGLNSVIGARMQSKADVMRKQLATRGKKINFAKMVVYSFDPLEKNTGNNNCFCNCDRPYEQQCDGCDQPCDW